MIAVPSRGRTITALIERHVVDRPEAVALVCQDEWLTYRALGARVGALAARLVGEGIGPGVVAGVYLPRSIDTIVGLLAVLKTGAAYTMLDPEYPTERLRTIVAGAGVTAIVTGASVLAEAARLDGTRLIPLDLPATPDAGAAAGTPSRVRIPVVRPEFPACVMFTSGSTGRPKGVIISHGALTGTFLDQDFTDLDAEQVWLQGAPVSWDGFALELYGALLFGGTCVLHPGQRPDPETVAELVAAHGVTTLILSAALFNLMVDQYPATVAGVKILFTVGEPASVSHVARVLGDHPSLRVANAYGPVECAIITNSHTVRPHDVSGASIPVGRPLADRDVFVLDEALRPVDHGQPGEVYAAGGCLAFGYVGQPGETAGRFLPNPYGPSGSRMYRTGDIGWMTADGVLSVTGRIDDQVKIRGYRIEPGEVAAVLRGHPAVGDSAVLVRDSPAGEHALAAYVVPRRDAPDPVELREYLRGLLPYYMIPATVTVLPALPLTANGKLDRAALPAPGPAAHEPPDVVEYDGAGADLMGQIALVWREVLGVGTIRPSDDFALLGGHSLNAVRVVHLLRHRIAPGITLHSLISARDLADFTAQVRDVLDAGVDAGALVPLLTPRRP